MLILFAIANALIVRPKMSMSEHSPNRITVQKGFHCYEPICTKEPGKHNRELC